MQLITSSRVLPLIGLITAFMFLLFLVAAFIVAPAGAQTTTGPDLIEVVDIGVLAKGLSVLSGICFLLAFIPYIRAILQGKTKPQKASWIIWLTVDFIVAVAMVKQGVMNGQMTGVILGAGSVAVLAFKYGEPGWKLLDKVCLSAAIAGIVLWNVLDSALLGMMISLGVIFIGAIPTFKRAWMAPETESKLAWTLFWISCIFALLAVPVWTLEHATQPVVFFVIETVMMWLLFIRGGKSRPSF